MQISDAAYDQLVNQVHWEPPLTPAARVRASVPLTDPSHLMVQWVVAQIGSDWSHVRTTRRVVLLHSLETNQCLSIHDSDNSSRASNPVLRVACPVDDATRSGLERLKEAFVDPPRNAKGSPHFARFLLGWHGADANVLPTMIETGPRSMRTTDAGFFGVGTYFALEASYASRYAVMGGVTPNGEYGIVLYAISVSQTHVVTVDNDYDGDSAQRPPHLRGFSKFYSGDPRHSIALSPMCDSHFVPVKKYGYVHPKTGVPVPLDLDYQAVAEHSGQAEAHELVIGTQFRCIPLAVVYFV
jgi:hypothetical protein